MPYRISWIKLRNVGTRSDSSVRLVFKFRCDYIVLLRFNFCFGLVFVGDGFYGRYFGMSKQSTRRRALYHFSLVDLYNVFGILKD